MQQFAEKYRFSSIILSYFLSTNQKGSLKYFVFLTFFYSDIHIFSDNNFLQCRKQNILKSTFDFLTQSMKELWMKICIFCKLLPFWNNAWPLTKNLLPNLESWGSHDFKTPLTFDFSSNIGWNKRISVKLFQKIYMKFLFCKILCFSLKLKV